jgi:hypothetical protein
MPSLSPDERAWPPVLKAGWLQQTFVHWPFRPAADGDELRAWP